MRRRKPLSQQCFESLETRVLMTAGELVRNGSFEATVTTSDWAQTGSAPWQVGLSGFSNYHEGTKYAFTGTSSGGYLYSVTGSLYQQLAIPATSAHPTLEFWSKTSTAETTTTAKNDTMVVSIKDSTGAVTLQNLTTISNLNSVSSSAGPYTAAGHYTLYSFPLSQTLIGQTIRIDFNVNMNATLGTTFRIDDVSLAEPGPVTPGTSKQIVGYLPYYRQNVFSQIDLDYVTWINYFSLGATTAGALTTANVTDANLATVVNAAHAKGIGVSITVGPQSFNTMAGSASARAAFATNIKNYITSHNLDGVDIDWESPATGINQVNYGLLIDDLYAQLHPIGKKITAAVNPWTKEIPVPATREMDWVNVMCYDFDYADNSNYAQATDGMLQWSYYGVANNKLTMGQPFYGRSGTSWSNTSSKTYASFITDYTNVYGTPPSPDVDDYYDAAGTHWYINGVTTMGKKAAFVRDNGYAGSMIWELGQDHWDSSGNYDRYSQLPTLATVARPPAWLSNPTVGSHYALVPDQNQFIMHAGTATVSAAVSISNPNLNVNVWSGGRLISTVTQKLASLLIDDGGNFSLQTGGNKTLYLGTLTLAPNGKLDLNDDDIVVNTGNFSAIQALVFQGYRQSADLTATGIISTTGQTAPGNPILALFNNILVHASDYPFGSGNSISPTAIVGKYTYFGDTNLDGQVTADDYGALDANFGATNVNPGNAWLRGDTNFDGKVTADDYGALDANFGQGTTAPLAADESPLVIAPQTPPAPLTAPTNRDLLS